MVSSADSVEPHAVGPTKTRIKEMAMESLKLGSIITTRQKRDAIHIAVVPVVAAVTLRRGDWVRMSGGRAILAAFGEPEAAGVVDPYLNVEHVEVLHTFWLYLKPGSITALRHDWDHPAFPKESKANLEELEKSKVWVEKYAASVCLSYETIMTAADNWCIRGEEYYSPATEYKYVPEEFWYHYEVIRGAKVASHERDNFFSCCV